LSNGPQACHGGGKHGGGKHGGDKHGGAERALAAIWFCRAACDIRQAKILGQTLHSPADLTTSWPDTIHAHFQRVGVRQVGYVPDAGHSRLIALCRDDPQVADVVLTTEEEGVGLVAGAALGGQRAALLMQSSGVGNCINMFSLLRNCGFGCIVLVTMRGEFGEFNPWQVPMGTITEEVLQLSGFLTYRIETADAVDEIVGAGCDMAFDGNLQVAILLSQRLIGPKQWTR
jgi:sulfopyruvate decarboxylase alpha subunit